MIKEDGLFKIGQFTKPHGIKGEISLLTDYDISDISGNPYIVCNMDSIWVPFFIHSYRQKSNAVTLIKFEDIDSEDKVKLLTGKAAYVPLEIFSAHDNDTVNWKHLTGYTVIDDKSGEIGQVIDVDDSTLNILLKVDYKENEILIPVALITAMHQEHKTMEVSLPEGFLEI
jgi:16S rRNA processing protein RimM